MPRWLKCNIGSRYRDEGRIVSSPPFDSHGASLRAECDLGTSRVREVGIRLAAKVEVGHVETVDSWV